MAEDRRILYRRGQKDTIVHRKPFLVNGRWKAIVKTSDGRCWTEEFDPEVNARSPEQNEEMEVMDFPELEDLGAAGQEATDIVKDTKPVAEKVCFVGVGQAGCKIADTFYAKGYRRVLLLNTTQQDMAGLVCPNQLLIGKTKVGAGKNPEVGAQSVRDSAEEINRALYKAIGSEYERIVICTSGGGGTGSGATSQLVPLFRKYMADAGRPVKVGVIVCAPKKSEGAAVEKNSATLVTALRGMVDRKELSPLILVANERVGKLYPNVPIAKFHSVVNQNVVGLYNVFNELAAQDSALMTLDPADYKSVLDAGVVVFGMTTITTDDPTGMAEAVEKNMNNGMLSDAVKIHGSTHAGGILVASKGRLDSLPQANLDRAFEALGRVLGGNLTLHQGVYSGPDTLESRVLVYTIAGGCQWA